MYSYSQDFFRAKRKVVIYARVSTEHEAQLSALENQIDWYKPILDAHPEWELVGTYIDEGITGTSAEKREQFMKMIADAKEHKFDLIITREVSRFARNTVDTLQYTRELRRIGVEVFFLNDNIKTFDGDGELRLTIMATLDQDESRKTSIRVKSGQQTSMEKGVVYGNGNILGYKRVGKEMVIDPEQAKTVRLIYDLYLQGYGIMKIKHELEAKGIKTSTGKDRWAATVISNVLKNTFYYGVMTYHKEYVPDYLTQKKIKNKGTLELTQTIGKHEPIVTKEEYDKVQEILSKRTRIIKDKTRERRLQGVNTPSHPWSKLLHCYCGHSFNRQHYSQKGRRQVYTYICNRKRMEGSIKTRTKKGLPIDDVCMSPTLSEARLEMMAMYIFENYITKRDVIAKLAKEILAQHINDKPDMPDQEDLIRSLENELQKIEKRFDVLIELRADGEIDKTIFRKKKSELEEKKGEINKKLATLKNSSSSNSRVDLTKKLKLLNEIIDSSIEIEKNKQIPACILESFVRKIMVCPDHLEWHLRTGTEITKDDDKTEPIKLAEFKINREFAINFLSQNSGAHHFKFSCWKDEKIEIYI